MPIPGFVDQQQLAHWADTIGARSEFPRLIRRLLLETGRGILQLSMPAGEGVASGSWDGLVRATEETEFIPKGLSLWELSVEKSVGPKADTDYSKRTKTPDGAPTKDCVYVAAYLRRWTGRHDWARERTAEGRWQEVRGYGIDDIETWLEAAPVTHAWISEQLGLHPSGMKTAERWWTNWAGATTPNLSPDLVLAGRADDAAALLARLKGSPQVTTLKSGSVEEILAFIAAATAQGSANETAELLARTVFIDDLATWRTLMTHKTPLVLIPTTDNLRAEVASGTIHQIVVPVTSAVPADIELTRINAASAAEALRKAGLEERQADSCGQLARRSLLAVKRHLANKPELLVPSWAGPPVAREVRGVLLAGRWLEGRAGDREILTLLTGLDDEILTEKLSALAVEEDPLMAKVDQFRGLVSPYDAWAVLCRQLSRADLARLENAVISVLGETDPALDLPQEERWLASIKDKISAYSGDLRRGLATTLILLSVQSENLDLDGITGPSWASYLVRKLLEQANADSACRLWASLSDVLPLLGEAAPDAFLDAVRAGVNGHTPVLAKMFADEDSGFHSSSPHTGLLWALEAVAWSSHHFGQAVDLLARLAELDPGGRLSNRPFNSMAAIFCPWHPENSVNDERRLTVIDALRKNHENVAWRLMLTLLPSPHGVHLPTSEPKFRDWKPPQQAVKMVEYLRFTTEIVKRLLWSVGNSSERWAALIKQTPSLPPDDRELVGVGLQRKVEAGAFPSEEQRYMLWKALQSFVGKHREYSNADWALPAEELKLFEEIQQKLASSDPFQENVWLFEEHMPHLGVDNPHADHENYRAALNERRRQAVDLIRKAGGLQGLRYLAERAVEPWSVGVPLADSGASEYETELLDLIESAQPTDVEFALAYMGTRFRHKGWSWLQVVLAEHPDLSPARCARLLLSTYDFPKAWVIADELGPLIADKFWMFFGPFMLDPDSPHLAYVCQRLIDVNRPAAALHFLAMRLQEERAQEPEYTELVITGLEKLLSIDQEGQEVRSLLQEHHLEALFDYLNGHKATIGLERVARLEWAFLPALGFRPKARTLHQLLSENPAFFVDVVTTVYRPNSGDDPQGDSLERERLATNGYELLSSWSRVPGTGEAGQIDAAALGKWVDEALRLLDAVDRRAVGEVRIGHVFAGGPADVDGAWPCKEVRDLIEILQSESIEEGLRIEIYNRRGVTSRGLQDGGMQERALAAKYEAQANVFEDLWPRTATILRSVATSYKHDARRYDSEAERFRHGYDT